MPEIKAPNSSLSDRIVCTPGVCGGRPRIKGTRISVELITDLLDGGCTADYILKEYTWLDGEDIAACICYTE